MLYTKPETPYHPSALSKIQLLILPDMINTALAGDVPIKKVTNVRTIANAMQQIKIYKGMLRQSSEDIIHLI